ncbi:hypothetical protein U1Q18_049971, partial [Sarracenia purpurea var. burkii]
EKSNPISDKNRNFRSGGSAVRASATRPRSPAASPCSPLLITGGERRRWRRQWRGQWRDG